MIQDQTIHNIVVEYVLLKKGLWVHGAVGIVLPIVLGEVYFTEAIWGRLISLPGTEQTVVDWPSLSSVNQ